MRKVPMRKVAIVGAFTTPCRGRWLSKTIWELAQWAVSGALQAAKLKVDSGRYDIVLCIGAEKATDCYDFMSETQTPEVVQTIAWSWDPLFERDQGATAADSYAEVILSYMDQYPNDLKMAVRGEILRILCEQAKNNPNAQRRDEIVTPERVEKSPWIIEPAFKKLEP